jgi:DNA polymerase V
VNATDTIADHSLIQQFDTLAAMLTQLTIPLAGHRIAAGFPSPASDYLESSLDFNTYLVSNKAATFVFTVEGNSMTGAHIFDGDKLVVDRSIDARHNHIVVAVVNSEYTVKRLFMRGGVNELRAENPLYPPIRCNDFDDMHIWGVVTGVLRKLPV